MTIDDGTNPNHADDTAPDRTGVDDTGTGDTGTGTGTDSGTDTDTDAGSAPGRTARGRGTLPHRGTIGGRARRDALIAEQERHIDEVQAVDALIVDHLRRRLELLDHLDHLRDRLHPPEVRRMGRRPAAAERRSLRPTIAEPRPLWGRELRRTCRSVLRCYAELALPDLHHALHSFGYVIESPLPTKALADALGYELSKGRVRRIRHGVYAIDPDGVSPWQRRQEPPLIDPELDRDRDAHLPWTGPADDPLHLPLGPNDDPFIFLPGFPMPEQPPPAPAPPVSAALFELPQPRSAAPARPSALTPIPSRTRRRLMNRSISISTTGFLPLVRPDDPASGRVV